ncbi:MAG: flagellar motor protein MotD [Rhodocyclaceae bacterium]|nr:flagellar motor protein MotD [Rhodocyclaceae bacterium]MBX3668933.1 flagellar motor protein MotD [Rhodocyclaceae bacterium]
MSRRTAPEEHENHERWLVSYADFITLLFAFFVVMYAISSVNEGKYRVLSDAINSAFHNGRITILPAKPSDPQQFIQMQISARKVQLARERREKLRRMGSELDRALGALVKEGQVRMSQGAFGISIEINANMLFPSGDASLTPEATNLLRHVAEVLAYSDFPLRVEGHTDNQPISSERFPSNWELSAVRASSVVRVFAEAGVAPGRLTASGYGEQRPLDSNLTAEGRARNRRVSILVEAPEVQEVPDASAVADTAGSATFAPALAEPPPRTQP